MAKISLNVINGIVGEISTFDAGKNLFDIVWMTSKYYSAFPTRKRRIEMLKRIKKSLKPEGFLVCQFFLSDFIPEIKLPGKIFAWLVLGNLTYEYGDMLTPDGFLHSFTSEDEIRSEFTDAGYSVIYLKMPSKIKLHSLGGATLLAN